MDKELECLFVPYDQALELRNLGFDDKCFYQYTYKKDDSCVVNGELIPVVDDRNMPIQRNNTEISVCSDDNCFAAPLYAQAFSFLRKKYDFYHEIHVDRTLEPKFCFEFHWYQKFLKVLETNFYPWKDVTMRKEMFLERTYEAAELEALKTMIVRAIMFEDFINQRGVFAKKI